MSTLVTVQQLSKSYSGKEAVREVSFHIGQGEIFGLLGPNGAGKTSILECVAGLREPDAGRIMIGALDARRQPREIKEKIGVMLQATDLQDKITPREALKLFGSFYARALPPETLLARFALVEKADDAFRTLSGGQRQRLALALAFINQPEFILLDEPTAGLDPSTRRALHEEILRLRQDGRTILLSTHYLEEAERLCDRVAILDQGRIVATGAPRELIAASTAPSSVRLLTSPPLALEKIAGLPGVGLIPGSSPTLFQTNDPSATLAGITRLLHENNAQLLELQIKPPTLEDVFLRLVATQPPGPAT